MSAAMPLVAETYDSFTGQCFGAGALDERTKQLIALGVALFANNEVCTYYHVQEALAKGASDAQVMEAAAVAAAAASGHVLSQGMMRVQGVLEEADTLVNEIEPDRLRSGMQDYLQDAEFALELDAAEDGTLIPGKIPVSPSF